MFDSDKIVLTKNDAFVGKGYCNQSLFMLNVAEILNNKASSSSACESLMDAESTVMFLLLLAFAISINFTYKRNSYVNFI